MNEWLVVAASAGVVGVMVAFAAMLGFRKRARLDEAQLKRLASAEGAALEAYALASNARSAISLLSADRLMVARVMADGVSTRVAPLSAAHVRVGAGRVRVAVADLGFPPLSLRTKEAPPAWLVALARET